MATADDKLRIRIESAADEFARRIESGGPPAAEEALRLLLERLAATGIEGPENRGPSVWLWDRLGELLQRGVLQRRAREKPLGYAGDFQLLQWIVDRVIPARDELGAAMDRHFQAEAAPQSVRNRTQLAAEAIVQAADEAGNEPVRVLSYGCGAAADVALALSQLPAAAAARLHCSLWDLDPRALEHAETTLAVLKSPADLSFQRDNLFRLPKRAGALDQLGAADLVLCTGLLDYFAAADAAGLLRMFRGMLRPRGRLLAFNFTLPNPSRPYMEWIGNWYLIYRSSDEMRELAEAAGFASVRIAAEPRGVAIYADCRVA